MHVKRSVILIDRLGPVRMLLKRGMGNGEWGMGNGEWGMGNGEWGMGNGEWGIVVSGNT